MRNDRYSLPAHPAFRPALTALALFLAGPQPAQAVSWKTGANAGNWVFLDPTSAEVGIGTSSGTNPAEKLTISAGNILVDNHRFYRGKTTGGVLTNVIGLDNSNSVSIYGGKLVVGSSGSVTMNSLSAASATMTSITASNASLSSITSANVGVAGNISVFGNAQINSGATIGTSLLVNGRLGVNYQSSISDFYVLGKTNFNGPVNITGGNVAIDTRLVANGGMEAAWVTVLGNLNVSGSKNFVHPHPTDETRKIVYVAAEAGEALTMARGISRTENGQATVQLPDHFALVTSEEAPLTVQLTVEGAPALIYVVSKSKQEIVVKMKTSDFHEFQDVTFNYFVQGVRDGFEDHIAIQDIHPAGEDPQPSSKRARYDERVKKAFSGARNRSH